MSISKPSKSQLPLTRLKADLLLLVAAIAWGSGFVVQRLAAASLGVFIFNGSRFLLGALLILPLAHARRNAGPLSLRWAALAGLFLFSASALQQAGLKTTTAANGGFLTGLYVVIVPFLLFVFWRQRIPLIAWTAAFLATAGVYFISTGGAAFRAAPGDWLVLGGAIFWALHVIVVGLAAQRFDALRFAVAQFIFCGLANLAAGLVLESSTLVHLSTVGWTVLYSAVFSVAVGFTVQVVGQQHTPAGDAALIMSLESVFAALFGFIFLSEALLPLQLVGCVLIMVAVLLAQIDVIRRPARQAEPADSV